MKRLIGLFLMLASAGFLLWTYWPFIFPSSYLSDSSSSSYSLSIPKISASAPIILNVDPFNPEEYRAKLKNGVAHAAGSALPGVTPGTTYLFAHSSDYPWNLTRYNTAFFKLNQLESGDEIFINDLKYQVTDKKIVSPSEVEYLTNQPSNQSVNLLILQTCSPPGTSWRRLLIFAELTVDK